jgi:hypothetical protein
MHPDLLPAVAERCRLASELEALVRATGSEDWSLPSGNPGWSCHDLLAHLATGDWLMQRFVRDALAGKDLAASMSGVGLDGENARLVTAGRSQAPAELLAQARAQLSRSLALWELLDERSLTQVMPRWDGGFWSLRDYLLAFPGHERGHIAQLRAALSGSAAL